jgi:glycosyltransferase involved in cell wall biosynthesis
LIKIYGKKVKFYTKQGKRGKAFSIIEGVAYSKFDTICMIDADLQYAPEYIAPMYTLMNTSGKDIVITKRTINETSILRKTLSSGFNLVFTRLMFGINYDTQSGLKLFKAKVFEKVEINPSPWGFDLEFIVTSLMSGFTVTSMDINFSERTNGDAKVNVFKTSLELAKESIKLRSKISKKSLKTFYVKNMEVA